MRFFGRPIALIMVCSLALLCTACGSKNKGKIEGKWKMTEASGVNQAEQKNLKEMTEAGTYVYYEFKGDNTLVLGLHSDNPDMLKMLKAFAPNQQISWNVKYRLLSGEGVEIYDLPKDMQKEGGGGLFGKNKDRARAKIHIDGDNMTITDDDGKAARLTRVK